MQDRSSRPKTSPNKTDKATSKRCISQEIRLREGPVQLAARLGIAPSTVHRILTAGRLHRLSYMGRATGEPLRRYEHPHPGSLVHVDMKKLGNIPDGGGWRYVGRRQGDRNRAATPGKPNSKWHSPKIGDAFVHTVLDDHSRVAYTEVHDDGTARTAVEVLLRAVDWFAQRGVTIERVLSDNGAPYRSHLWGDTCEALSITPKRTRAPTGRRRMARSSVSTARWLTGGPTPAVTPANRNAETPSPAGSTSTTSTDPTRPAATSHPSRD